MRAAVVSVTRRSGPFNLFGSASVVVTCRLNRHAKAAGYADLDSANTPPGGGAYRAHRRPAIGRTDRARWIENLDRTRQRTRTISSLFNGEDSPSESARYVAAINVPIPVIGGSPVALPVSRSVLNRS